MSEKNGFWVEMGYWLRAFATPFLLFGVSAFVVLFSGKDLVSAAISLLVLGTIAGVIYAEHIRRKYGCSNYFTKMNKDPYIRMKGDDSENKQE